MDPWTPCANICKVLYSYGCGVGRGGPSRGPAGGRRGTVMVLGAAAAREDRSVSENGVLGECARGPGKPFPPPGPKSAISQKDSHREMGRFRRVPENPFLETRRQATGTGGPGREQEVARHTRKPKENRASSARPRALHADRRGGAPGGTRTCLVDAQQGWHRPEMQNVGLPAGAVSSREAEGREALGRGYTRISRRHHHPASHADAHCCLDWSRLEDWRNRHPGVPRGAWAGVHNACKYTHDAVLTATVAAGLGGGRVAGGSRGSDWCGVGRGGPARGPVCGRVGRSVGLRGLAGVGFPIQTPTTPRPGHERPGGSETGTGKRTPFWTPKAGPKQGAQRGPPNIGGPSLCT